MPSISEHGARSRPADARRIAKARRALDRADRHLDGVDVPLLMGARLTVGTRVRQGLAARQIAKAEGHVARIGGGAGSRPVRRKARAARPKAPRAGWAASASASSGRDRDEPIMPDAFFGPDRDEPDMTQRLPDDRYFDFERPDDPAFHFERPDDPAFHFERPDADGWERPAPPPPRPAPPARAPEVVEALRQLGMGGGATPAQATAKYRELIRDSHPDRFPAGTRARLRAEERAKTTNAAYATLKRLDFFPSVR